jgi:hypothetical protein
MLNLGCPKLIVFSKVVRHLISEFEQTDIGPFLNKEGKDVQVLFLIKDLTGLESGRNEIDFEFEFFGRVCADGFLSMLLDENVDVFLKIRDDVLPHSDLLFLDFRHQSNLSKPNTKGNDFILEINKLIW